MLLVRKSVYMLALSERFRRQVINYGRERERKRGREGEREKERERERERVKERGRVW